VAKNDSRRPLRIAQVAPLWASVPPADYGGTELRVHWLTQGLLARGHEVTLYASGDSQTDAALKAVCQNNILDGMREGRAHHYDHYANAAWAEVLKECDSYDIIHCHSELTHIPFAILSTTPVVYSLRTALSIDDMWLLRRYPAITFAAMSRSQIRDLSDERRRTVPVIHNGCDFGAYELSASTGRYLAFLGRMGPHKNPVGAVHVARSAGWPIALAGRPQDPHEEAYFNRAVKPLIDGRSVTYVGPVNQAQKRAFLQEAAALIFPIEWNEPFGIVMIEAMACGTPVVARRSGSVEEVVDPGVTGFYADAVEELASLVPQALALDRRVVREHARRRFSHERMVDDYDRLYADVLRSSSRNPAFHDVL
jgi:glycosyltransferase involved in cell wall biosynthesis